jgi:hypothetical protein
MKEVTFSIVLTDEQHQRLACIAVIEGVTDAVLMRRWLTSAAESLPEIPSDSVEDPSSEPFRMTREGRRFARQVIVGMIERYDLDAELEGRDWSAGPEPAGGG